MEFKCPICGDPDFSCHHDEDDYPKHSITKDALEAILFCKGKTITKINLDSSESLFIEFSDSSHIELFDKNQQCYEVRWIRTDDNLKPFIGSVFFDATVSDGPTRAVDNIDIKEVESQFLIIKTSEGEFTVVSYNEHNGYYSGITLDAKITVL